MPNQAFTRLREVQLSEVGGVASLWRHTPTGAEILSVRNADENKCFGVTFRTPPARSTGIAHILEHSVLCGSERYPVREPFVELLKGSLQTFLNAFTYPDKTCYPVASANKQDFRNLVEVYLDAVFFPRLSEHTFQQEGWHLDASRDESGALHLGYKGVVFNEMKGVYSSPDSILMEQSQHSLFPDTTYGLDSGGDPAVIPTLTYQEFLDFHATHYHPSNARFFFWGDFPEEERFELISPWLDRFTARPEGREQSVVPLQSRLDSPRLLEFPFAAASPEDGEEGPRGHVTVNWLLCEGADQEEILLLEMLDHILLGLPGSPLRKALIESGLGEDLAGGGLESELRQATFSVGLRSISPQEDGNWQAAVNEVERLVMETLARLADEGIPKEDLAAAVNTVEFDLREDNSGRFPRGLSAMLRSLTTWLYDGDPLAPLAWEKPLAALKARLASGEKIFEDAIRRHFLDNSHRTVVALLPDGELEARRNAEEEARFSDLAAGMSQAEAEAALRLTEELRQAQAAPDSPEALATIPSLGLDDLPRKNPQIPSQDGESRGTSATLPLYLHELDSSGILYADLVLPLIDVPARLLPLLPLFARCLTEIGTERHDFVQLGSLLASKTGGIGAVPLVGSHAGDRSAVPSLLVSGKATNDKIDDLFALIQEILLEPRLDNPERFGQMLLEERARLEQSLIPAGHSMVMTRLRGFYSQAGHLGEVLGGISYLESLRQLSGRLTDDWPGVLADLESLRGIIAHSPHPVIRQPLLNLTGDATGLKAASDAAASLVDVLPERAKSPAARWSDPVLDPAPAPGHEALIIPAQVNYVGKGCNLYDQGYVWHGSAAVITRHVRMAWLWDQVRVRGGAYGAFCGLDRLSGTFTLASYRDPNVEKTLQAYDGIAGWLRDLPLSERDLRLAIVGAIGDLDTYLLPDAKGRAALSRRLCGDSEADRQRLRDEILGTTAKDFQNFADIMAEAARCGTVCVLGGAHAEKAANQHGWTTRRLL